MLGTAARRALSATSRVYPSMMAQNTASSSAAARRGLGGVRWVPTLFTLVGIGYGVSAYRRNRIQRYLARNPDTETQRQEMNRRRRNTMLMDAYGEKTSLADIERAMALYETEQGNE